MGTTAKHRHRVLWLAAFAAGQAVATLASGTAWAQDQSTTLQQVTVTGSLIKRTDAEDAEAVTVLHADSLKAQGIVSVEQVITTLTSGNTSVNISSAVGSFSGGGTYANLRGLGNGRTLVLLDGQRLAPNAFSGLGVDVSGIPFSAIDRVEVLREGASALYGSDAIAGVINFITKKQFQGGEVQVNFDKPQDPGGDSGVADLTLGHGNLRKDGYNVFITGSFSKQLELRATQRGFSAQGFSPADGVTNTNFPGSWPGIFQDAKGNYWQAGYPGCAGNPQLTTYYGDCSYRYSAATDLLPESHESSGMAQFTKELAYNNEVKLQYFVTQSQLNAYSGPIEYFFQMDPSSPYYPTASQLTCARGAANCSTATPDYAGTTYAWFTDPNNNRFTGNTNIEQRALLTFSGNNSGWDYSTDVNFSKNQNRNTNNGGFPNEAVIAPGGVLSDLINPFGPQSAAGQALINSAYINGTYQVGQYTRLSFDGQATHPLGDAFNAGTPATLALGFTMSTEHYSNATTPYNDLVSASTGLMDSAVSGHRQIQAGFVELDVPMSKSFDLDISDRYDRYSDFGNTNNPKVQALYHFGSIVTLRGTVSTGFRAPTLANLYTPPYLTATGGSMGQGNPFCQPGSYNTLWTASACASQGIGLNGGNKNLTPETSKNIDLGIILSPIDNLGVTLDYFRVLVDNTIGGVPSSAIYGNPNAFTNYIVPATSGPNAGSLTPAPAEAAECSPYTASTCGYVLQQNSNTGHTSTSGFDVSVQYRQRTSVGTFSEDLEGTWVTQFKEQQYTGGPTLNLLGNVQIQYINPAFRWQHNITVDWLSPGKMWGAGLTDRFWSGYADEYANAAGAIPHVGSYNLLDAFASVTPIQKFTVLFGIKNLLNTNPPYTNASQTNFAAGYNSFIADPRLRNFYINVKYSW